MRTATTTSELETHVVRYIDAHQLIPDGARVVVGVSGGVDSMVLAHVLLHLGYSIVVAHVNYGLRDGADGDETFVRNWCASQTPAVPCHVTRSNVKQWAKHQDTSIQDAARDIRYAFMTDLAQQTDAPVVAVAHHRFDQAETFLLQLFRGAGVEGLAGMPPRRPLKHDAERHLVRPLLELSREDIEAYATSQGINWRTDPSNETTKYARGTVRNQLLPRIQQSFPGARGHIAHAAELLRDYLVETLQPALRARFQKHYDDRPDGGWLALEALRGQPTVWRHRLILEALRTALPQAPYATETAETIEELVDAQVGRHVDFGAGMVWREREGLYFVPHDAVPARLSARPVPFDTAIELPHGRLLVEERGAPPDTLQMTTPLIAHADADALSGALTVRTWQEGDRLQPLGMADGHKRVSDLLTDMKVPSHRRDGVLVLCDEEKIVWVVGYRLNHAVRVRPHTRRCVRITFHPDEKR
ncbi:tRNA lysidine(34) synthetase TilS [Salisaeta longa]|uniref:tRNA lysidine(34) synthetase TilS n=1 Tax=Salisaeta longa TaxID=503170 RepID=UPI000685E86E|nr:tRNA lysidine(34) synthetase TilS [Salisaeta longa]